MPYHLQPLLDGLGGAAGGDDADQFLDFRLPLLRGRQVALQRGPVDGLPDVGDEVGGGQDGAVAARGQRRLDDLVVPDEDAHLPLHLLKERLQEGHVPR
jgi:hypothetical protein